VEGVDAQELLALAFENSPLGMTLSVVSPHVPGAPRHFAFKVNKAFAGMLGYTTEELVDTTDQGRFTHPEDRLQDMANLQALLAGDQQVAEWDKRYIHAEGHLVWGRVSVSLLGGPDGQPRCLIAQIQDITDRHELEQQLLERAERDALTGLLNRSALEEHAEEQLARCRRYGETAALLVIDFDDLKQINDRYGHVVGDTALIRVADVLRGRLRAADVAARYGGDEFVVLLPHTDHVEARRIASDLATAIGEASVGAGDEEVRLGVSIGSSEINGTTPAFEVTLTEADREMYRNKHLRQAQAQITLIPETRRPAERGRTTGT
jgi:diguanylate cyclase (GGDEF)-like protein/PAS domain S-box-containing protein